MLGAALSRRALVAVLFALPVWAVELPTQVPAQIQGISNCVKANSPGKTMRQSIELEAVDEVGDRRSYDLRGEWKRAESGRSRIVLRVLAPGDERGNAFLIIPRQGRPSELFRYLPENEKVQQISMRAAVGQLFGSDFSYEDFRRIQNLARSANAKLLAEVEVDGRVAWQIETRPKPEDGSAYTRIVSAIDKERCVPLRVQFYRGQAEPSKLLLVPAEHARSYEGGWLPMQFSGRLFSITCRVVREST